MPLPRGVRNKNPYNLMLPGAKDFLGFVKDDGEGYAIFDTVQHGIRAANVNLQTYAARGQNTIRLIIAGDPQRGLHGWSATDQFSYIKAVSGLTTWNVDEPLELDRAEVLLMLGKAMIRFENGSQPYTDDVLLQGIDAALGGDS